MLQRDDVKPWRERKSNQETRPRRYCMARTAHACSDLIAITRSAIIRKIQKMSAQQTPKYLAGSLIWHYSPLSVILVAGTADYICKTKAFHFGNRHVLWTREPMPLIILKWLYLCATFQLNAAFYNIFGTQSFFNMNELLCCFDVIVNHLTGGRCIWQ